MNVLIVSPNFGVFGGCEAFVFRLADELHAHGINAKICLKRVKGAFALDETMQQYMDQSPVDVVLVDRASAALYREIREADLVHGQNTSIDVSVLSKLLGKPLVLTIHGWLREPWSVRGLLAQAARALSDRRWYNSNFVWEKWEPNGKLPTSGKMPIVSDLPEGIVPPEKRKGFVFAARWIENKGLEVLVQAYARADIDRAQWPLTLLGDGPLRPKVEQMVSGLGLSRVVSMPGFVDEEVRNNAIRYAKWMVTPPHTDEDLGLTPIEARHVGVPAIITRDGGLPEAGGTHALTCEPRDVRGLQALLEKAARMPERTYEKISVATHDELMEYLKPMSSYIDAYSEVLKAYS